MYVRVCNYFQTFYIKLLYNTSSILFCPHHERLLPIRPMENIILIFYKNLEPKNFGNIFLFSFFFNYYSS